jgi:hypothetical protein
MSATRLPDGSVVMRPSGQRAVNPRGGAPKAVPAVTKGPGPGASGKRVGVKTRQPGRVATPVNAYR